MFTEYTTIPKSILAVEVKFSNLDELLKWGRENYPQYRWYTFNTMGDYFIVYDDGNWMNTASVGDWLIIDTKNNLDILRQREQYKYRKA